MASLYAQGLPVTEIANRAGVCVKTVRNIARRFELPPNVGWWLVGLLAADGSIHAKGHRVSLCQTVDDADVLRAFYDYVGCPERPLAMLNLSPDAQLRHYPRRPAPEARIFSRRIVTALARHGVVPRKTATMKLSEEAAGRAAVWLGILTGDGSVGIYRGGRDLRVRFAGSRLLMEQCERFWRRALRFTGAGPSARAQTRALWVFDLTGPPASAAAAELLEASPISMERKRAKLLALVARSSPPEARGPSCAPLKHQAASI